MTITKPKHPRNHPDRFNECQMAIGDKVLGLWGDAIEAGWDKDEVLAAMIEVAENTNLAINATVLVSVETELRRYRKKKDV